MTAMVMTAMVLVVTVMVPAEESPRSQAFPLWTTEKGPLGEGDTRLLFVL